MSSSSPFDAGNMTATPPPPQSKKRAWEVGDEAAVTCIDFSKQPKFEKATHPDSFPANKDKLLTTVKPIELENWKTRSKIGYWGILFNTCIKYDGQLVVELQKICEISR